MFKKSHQYSQGFIINVVSFSIILLALTFLVYSYNQGWWPWMVSVPVNPTPTPTPLPTPTVTPVVTTEPIAIVPSDQYALKCQGRDNNETVLAKYPWYKTFTGYLKPGWRFETICYNAELNKVVYLKATIGEGGLERGQNQLGVYSITNDDFVVAPKRDLGIYEGCGTINAWLRSGQILFDCGVSGGGGQTDTYSFDIATKTQKLIRRCVFNGDYPEECTDNPQP